MRASCAKVVKPPPNVTESITASALPIFLTVTVVEDVAAVPFVVIVMPSATNFAVDAGSSAFVPDFASSGVPPAETRMTM
ncbi:hypothetical protein CE91St43_27920 [Oscillospiraceae bacterium]|nr:hypothetical protein CE91St43_27920 [Oscillospiraceae bacterium]